MTVIALEHSKLTDRYQTTVPSGVRRQLNLKKGDRISYRSESNGRVYIEAAQDEVNDPALVPFLDLLEADLKARPESIQPVDSALLDRTQTLVGDVEVDLNAPLSPDDE